MKRSVFAIVALFALGWSAAAFADATTIGTTCPNNFTCAFSAAESMSLVAPSTTANKPGQPDVFLGYMEFDGSSPPNVTMTGVANTNGTVKPIGTVPPNSSIPLLSGPCTNGANGQPATISLSDKSEISFVVDSSISELQFILTKDPNTASNSTAANGVRVGVCRKQ